MGTYLADFVITEEKIAESRQHLAEAAAAGLAGPERLKVAIELMSLLEVGVAAFKGLDTDGFLHEVRKQIEKKVACADLYIAGEARDLRDRVEDLQKQTRAAEVEIQQRLSCVNEVIVALSQAADTSEVERIRGEAQANIDRLENSLKELADIHQKKSFQEVCVLATQGQPHAPKTEQQAPNKSDNR